MTADVPHSELPPSSSDKWIVCHGWLSLNRDLPPGPPSPAADEGTEAHTLLEQALLGNHHVLESHANSEMVDYVMACAEYARNMANGWDANLHSERRVDFGSQFHFVGLTGTSDVIIENEHLLAVLDLKYGFAPVEVQDNPQLMTYLSGAVAEFGPRPNYLIGIMQPRAPHDDGPFRTLRLRPDALEEFNARLETAIVANYLRPKTVAGPHCKKYCRALGFCRTAKDYALSIFLRTPE